MNIYVYKSKCTLATIWDFHDPLLQTKNIIKVRKKQ